LWRTVVQFGNKPNTPFVVQGQVDNTEILLQTKREYFFWTQNIVGEISIVWIFYK
jgi:hypothetical protein